jgi:kinesin family member 11
MVVKTSADIYALLDRGSAKRRTAETLLNKQSSRSHSVFCITVHIREYSADGEEVIKIGKLYLVCARFLLLAFDTCFECAGVIGWRVRT